MSDIVVRLELRTSDEAEAFGDYLTRYVQSREGEADDLAAALDAPFLMVRSEPLPDADLRVLTFQEPRAASAFASGWAQRRRPRPTA